MREVVTAAEMKMADENTSAVFGMDAMVLMERAALCIAERIQDTFSKEYAVFVLAGSGGNGGDGVAVARILKLNGYDASVFVGMPEEKWNETMKKQVEIARQYQVAFVTEFPQKEKLVAVDALFGNGMSRDITGQPYDLIEKFNALKAYKIAVDLPSGIHSDTGQVCNIAAEVDETITFAFIKQGLLLTPGCKYAGKIHLRDVGITKESFLTHKVKTHLMEKADFFHRIYRDPNGNKGTFGKVLVIAGAEGMAGAGFFSAKAALRVGAGMVKILTASSNREIYQKILPEAMLAYYDDTKDLKKLIRNQLKWCTVCLIGPGLGRTGQAEALIQNVADEIDESSCQALVIDADAINLVAGNSKLEQQMNGLSRTDVVYTPHLLEFERLSHIPLQELKTDLLGKIRTYCTEKNAIYVCKDARTVVCYRDEQWILQFGSDALATAGSGDCLAGMIAALLAQTKDLLLSACAGVYLHSICGELAADRYTKGGVMAGDLLEVLPDAMRNTSLIY